MEAVLQPELLLAAGIVFVSGIVRGFSGFGQAMVMAPVFALLFAPPQAVATMAGLGILASLQLLPGAFRAAEWRVVLPLSVVALCTIPAGAYVLLSLDADVMRRGISAIVLVMVLALMSGWRYPAKPGLWGTLGVGALSGAINGASGVGGPPVVLYLLAGPDAARTSRANIISYYCFLNGGTYLSLYVNGVITPAVLWRTLALWPVLIVSLWSGAWLFRHATDRIYRRIALAVLLGVALFGLVYK